MHPAHYTRCDWLLGLAGQLAPHVFGIEAGQWLDRRRTPRRRGLRRQGLHHRVPRPRAHLLVPLVGSVDHRSDLTGDHGGSVKMLGGGLIVSGDDVPK